MAEIGSAELTIIPSFKGGQRALERQLGATGGSARGGGSFQLAGRSAGSAFAGGLRAVAGPAMAVLGGAAAFNFAEGAISQASDVGESINALSVVYGDAADEIVRMGEAAASERGLSSLDFNNLSVQFSAFTKTIAGEGGDVIGTLDDLTMRATDFASVMNLDVAEAATIFQSSLAGETEPIRRFGIDLSAAAVEAYAYANGIGESGEALTEAQKVQARYGLLMEQTNQTAGDFANTSDSLANQQRILNAEWANMQAQLGTALLPVMQDVTGWLLSDGLPALQGFVSDLGDPTTAIGGLVQTLGDVWDDARPAVTGALEFGTEVGGMIVSGLAIGANTYNEDGWDQVVANWGDGVGIAVDKTSTWDDAGASAGQKFIRGAVLVMNSFAEGTVGEDWWGGAQIIGERFADDMKAGFTSGMDNFSLWLQENGIDNGRAQAILDAQAPPTGPWDPAYWTGANLGPTYPSGIEPNRVFGIIPGAQQQPAITANPNAGSTIVNIQQATFSDTAEAARLAEREKRSASLSGSRPINRGMR